MSFGVWDEPKRSPFATYVSHDTSLNFFGVFLGGGQFVKLEKKKFIYICAAPISVRWEVHK